MTNHPQQGNSGKILVYSCSGCSNVAQAANTMAVRLDREGLAEMSCIAGVGAGVPPLVRVAKSGRRILAIDGCPLACCWHALANHDVEPDSYVELSKHGLKKRQHQDLDDSEVEEIMNHVVRPALQAIPARDDSKHRRMNNEES